MDVILIPLVKLIGVVVNLYIWALILSVILSWLIQFGVINSSNQFVATVGEFLYRLTEPVLDRVRKVLPNLGGIDFSPLVVILLLYFLLELLERLVYRLVT
jgi:YggT family protein